MRKIIIDTDPGVDDAIAIMLLAKSKLVDILAITTVAGNSTIENTSANAEYLKNLLNLACPIYSGASKAMSGPFIEGQVHGVTGLTGITHDFKPQITSNAAEKIVELINRFPGEVTVLCLGPQTNLAKALVKDPGIASKIKQIVIMGGAIMSPGNKSWVSEFNIFLDPEAADYVFSSNTPKVLIPLSVCYQTPLTLSDIDSMSDTATLKPILKQMISPYIKLLSQFEGVEGAIVYDALAAYYLINPQAFTIREIEIKIETKGKYTRGMTVADLRTWGDKKPNVKTAFGLNQEKFIEDITNILGT